jgi:hypothetical protein
MTLFKSLQDETPASIGEEIGAVMAPVVSEIGQSNVKLAASIALSTQRAFAALQDKFPKQRPVVSKWRFSVVRNKSGDMTDVIATAEEWVGVDSQINNR